MRSRRDRRRRPPTPDGRRASNVAVVVAGRERLLAQTRPRVVERIALVDASTGRVRHLLP